MAKIEGVSSLSSSFKLASTAGRILVNAWDAVNKRPKVIDWANFNPATDLVEVGMFAEGTFAFDGEEGTSTARKFENGSVYANIVGQGTNAFSGELPNMAKEVLEYLHRAANITPTTEKGWSAWWEGYDVTAIGKDVATWSGIVVLLEFEQGDAFDFLGYGNATISAQMTGEGSTEGELRTALAVTGAAMIGNDYPEELRNHTMILGKKK